MDSETKNNLISELQVGYDLLFNQARLIALLPLEDWIEAFEKADTIGPILDPTLYREWIYSGKREIFLSVFRAALELKTAVLRVQPKLKDIIEREAKHAGQRAG